MSQVVHSGRPSRPGWAPVRSPAEGVLLVNSLPPAEQEVIRNEELPPALEGAAMYKQHAQRAFKEVTHICDIGTGCDTCIEKGLQCRARLPNSAKCANCHALGSSLKQPCNVASVAGYPMPGDQSSVKYCSPCSSDRTSRY